MKRLFATMCTVVIAAMACTAGAKPPPPAIEELREAERNVSLEFVGDIAGGPGFTAELYRYESAALQVHAMVARPIGEPPEGGWPVLIANHGHHPDPPQYGITADGEDHRPGDYYRKIPELYVARGYLVVMPDFRGHNNSEGFEYTEGMLESAYYTEDVLNLLAGLGDIDGLDTDRVFMWGHSMGGEVTLRALLATNAVKAASMWSSVGGDIWDQSYYYSRYEAPEAFDSSETPKSVVERLRGRMAAFDDEFDYRGSEPLLHLEHLQTPLIIQHAVGDRGAAYKWSERLAKELYMLGKPYAFYTYPGDDHLFKGDAFELAVSRDAKFFQTQMAVDPE